MKKIQKESIKRLQDPGYNTVQYRRSGAILEVELHNHHNDYPLGAEKKVRVTEEMLSPYSKEIMKKVQHFRWFSAYANTHLG